MIFLWFTFLMASYEFISYNKTDYKLVIDPNDNIKLGTVNDHQKTHLQSHFHFKESKPGEVVIMSVEDNPKMMNFDKNTLSMSNDAQQWTVSLSSNGSFRISRGEYCITVASELEVEMSTCSNKDSELFILRNLISGDVLKSYGGPVYSFKSELE
ncbi:hypothetical protein NGRA_0531 [Nosema granulosis]|uniref:Fascin domain-containing protein n=1 Tax=Nosema granulosis TaxID=83296 RepID=A0A9P6H0Q9_9MICR|nr:hypothetical protein NGRA_0531 [Nosema granulosis]